MKNHFKIKLTFRTMFLTYFSASEAVLSDLNGKSGQVISPAAASDQVADDQNEPKEKEPLVAKEPEPEAEVEAAPEPEPEPAQAAEPEPESEKVEEAAPEKEEEPFEVVQKEDLPEEESVSWTCSLEVLSNSQIEKIEAPVEEEEEKMLTEKADETPAQESEKKGEDDELPDFEDEEEPEQNEDALQLDANIEEDDDLNKVLSLLQTLCLIFIKDHGCPKSRCESKTRSVSRNCK